MSNPPEKRTIKINPDLFKFSTTNTTRKKRTDTAPRIKVKSSLANKEASTKTLKRKLLKHIRSFQEDMTRDSRVKDKAPPPKKDDIPSDTVPEFKDSMDYLLKLTKELEKRENVPAKNYTLKQRGNINLHDVLNTPNNVFIPTNESVSLEMPRELGAPIPIVPKHPTKISHPVPEYGCLKNGVKPTYRTWKNHTQRVYPPTATRPSPIINLDPTQQRIEQIRQRAKITRVNQLASSPEPMRLQKPESQKISDIIKREQMKQMKELKAPKKIKRPKQCQKTMRRTYRVGRSKVAPRITVLVSNKTIRKNITTQAQLLKQVPIKDVKQYLIKHGFIRVGSIAPNEVLRRMYETARMMCGEIHNHNPDNMLYNFLNGDREH